MADISRKVWAILVGKEGRPVLAPMRRRQRLRIAIIPDKPGKYRAEWRENKKIMGITADSVGGCLKTEQALELLPAPPCQSSSFFQAAIPKVSRHPSPSF